RFSIRLWQQYPLRLIHSKTQALTVSLVPPASVCPFSRSMRGTRSPLQMRLFQISFLTDLVSRSPLVFGFVVLTTPAHGAKNSLTGTSCLTWGCVVKWDGSPIILRRVIGKLVSVTLGTKDRTCPLARSASPDCARRFWTAIQPRRLIRS